MITKRVTFCDFPIFLDLKNQNYRTYIKILKHSCLHTIMKYSETFFVLRDFSGLIITNTHLIYVMINELMP